MTVARLLCLLLALLLAPAAAPAEDAVYSFAAEGEHTHYINPLVVFTEPPPTPTPEPTATPEPTVNPSEGAPLEVHFINVASADCILLKKGEMTMMIDAGNASEADRIVAYLNELGIEKLDYAMFTHPHGDHIQGYTVVLDAVEVGEFLQPALFEGYSGEGSDALGWIYDALERKGIPLKTLEHGDSMDFAGATIRFYQWQNPDAMVNNRSMIEHITWGDSKVLLAADLESHAQKALAEELGSRLRADLLKMPHHGLASYTRELHDAVQPQFATVSHTRGNETVENTLAALTARGVDWKLTVKGTIVCVSDGTAWNITQK